MGELSEGSCSISREMTLGVSLQMALEVEVSVKHSRAVRTLESFDSAVNLDVFVKISSLSEAEPAVGEGAGVRPLVCVDSQVVEKVVPFSKVLSAIVVVTLQDLDIPLGLGVLEGEDSEFLGIRNVLFDLDGLQVEGLTSLDVHNDVFRNTLECVTVLYFVNFHFVF